MAAGDTWFHGDGITWFEGADGRADFDYSARGFVAEDHGGCEDVGADGAVVPVVYLFWERMGSQSVLMLMLVLRSFSLRDKGAQENDSTAAYIAPTNTRIFDLDQNIMWGFYLRYRPVLKLDFVDPLKDKREVLRPSRTRTSVSLCIFFLIVRAGILQGCGGIRCRFNGCCRCFCGSGAHFGKSKQSETLCYVTEYERFSVHRRLLSPETMRWAD